MPLLRLVLALVVFAAAQPALAKTLRVLSYNIHHSEGRDGVYDLDRIANIILAAKPDIVALQELDQGNTRSGANVFQLQELAERTDMQGYFGKTINYMGGAYGNGVLVAPWLTIVGTTNHALPNPGNNEARAIIQMGLSFDADPRTVEFNFFATHLDSSSQANRNAQAPFVNNLVANSTTPAILAGDMNSRPTTDSYAFLASQWNDATNMANPGISRSTQIDYIFTRSDKWVVKQRAQFIVNSTTAVASDHYPLLSVIDLPYPNADFNGDYVVDGADYLLWQRHNGSSGGIADGDANEDGVVNDADLAVWRAQFGTPRPRPGGRAVAVPEPCAATMAIVAAQPFLARRIGCRRTPLRCRRTVGFNSPDYSASTP